MGEKIGNVGLGLLRIGFGRVFKVECVGRVSNEQVAVWNVFTQKEYSTAARVSAIALAILLLPITIFLAGIGCIGNAFSKSRRVLFDLQELPVPQVRRTPPQSLVDTMGVEGRDGELFADNDIVHKSPIVRTRALGEGVYATYTTNRKAIVQQQAARGCTAATAAMLILDHGRLPNVNGLRERNLGNTDDQVRDLEVAGLTAKLTKAATLDELERAIRKNGSAIVSISGSIGSHVVVVDEVSAVGVRLRDPYHGWEIIVTRAAFEREWGLLKEEIIQVD